MYQVIIKESKNGIETDEEITFDIDDEYRYDIEYIKSELEFLSRSREEKIKEWKNDILMRVIEGKGFV